LKKWLGSMPSHFYPDMNMKGSVPCGGGYNFHNLAKNDGRILASADDTDSMTLKPESLLSRSKGSA
jgi:hypothetical protein